MSNAKKTYRIETEDRYGRSDEFELKAKNKAEAEEIANWHWNVLNGSVVLNVIEKCNAKKAYKVNDSVTYFGTRHTVTATIADAETNEPLSVIVRDDANGRKFEVSVDYDFLAPVKL